MTQEQTLELAQSVLGYTFKQPQLLIAALTHSSHADSRLNSNERLEFVGDAILAMVVCTELYVRFPHLLEGEMTKIKSAVVSRRTCAKISRELGLSRLLFLGKGMSARGQLPNSLAAAVFEALIAAIYLDSNDIAQVRDFILRAMTHHINEAADSENQRNFKSQLQQYAQKKLMATPIYDLLDEKGPDHSKCFEVGVVIRGRRYASAWGPSKKEAEQKAAYFALREMEVVAPSSEFESQMEAI